MFLTLTLIALSPLSVQQDCAEVAFIPSRFNKGFNIGRILSEKLNYKKLVTFDASNYRMIEIAYNNKPGDQFRGIEVSVPCFDNTTRTGREVKIHDGFWLETKNHTELEIKLLSRGLKLINEALKKKLPRGGANPPAFHISNSVLIIIIIYLFIQIKV